MEPTFQFELLDEVECTVTGYKGKVTGRFESLHGRFRYEVTSSVNANGSFSEAWIDETRLRYQAKEQVS